MTVTDVARGAVVRFGAFGILGQTTAFQLIGPRVIGQKRRTHNQQKTSDDQIFNYPQPRFALTVLILGNGGPMHETRFVRFGHSIGS